MNKIDRPDLHLEVTAQLVELVVSSPPGTRLPSEQKLCAQLGVGRSTVREAIRSLSFIGAVEVRQGCGTYVARAPQGAWEKLIGLALMVQRAKVREVVEARRVLEVGAVRLAALRYQESDRRELEAVMARMSAAVSDPGEASRHDIHYHVLLGRSSHNCVIQHLIEGMRALLEIWITRAVNRPEVVASIVEEHTAVLDAVFRRDVEEAGARMDLHLSRAADRLLRVIGQDQSAADYVFALFQRPREEASAGVQLWGAL